MSTPQVPTRADGAPMNRPGLGLSVNVSRDVQPPSSHRTAKSLEHGGAVRGRGTSTSDSVPIWASNGEFMLPADTTAAVGKEKLQALIDATHAQVGRGAVRKDVLQARADGGLIDPLKTPGTRGLAAGPAGAPSSTVAAAAAAVATAPDAPSASFHGVAAPTPSTPPGAVLPDAVHPGRAVPSDLTAKQVPLGGVQAGPSTNAAPVTRAPAVTAIAPEQSGAVFGIYPNPNSRLSSHANDNALARGITAAGPSTFRPANALNIAPLRLDSATDPRSTVFRGAPGANAAAMQTLTPSIGGAATPFAAAAAGAVRPPATAPQPAAAAPAGAGGGAVAAGAPSSTVLGVGNSYSGANVSGDVSINGRPAGGGFMSMPGVNFAGGAPGASAVALAPVAPGAGLTVIGDSGAAGRKAAADFFTDASQRNDLRAAQGAPGGWRAQAAQVAQAQGAIATTASNRAQGAAGAVRDAGETLRTGMREQGDDRRAALRDAGEQRRADQADRRYGVRDALDRDEFGLKRTAAESANRSAKRIEAAQLEVQHATTPSARRSATEKLAALSGRAAQDNFAAIEIGGGTEPIDPANPMLGVRTLPKTPVIFNKATGQIVTPGGARRPPRAAPPEAIAALKANPQDAEDFDEKYGVGAAARAFQN